jgi:hypothetical protein
MWIFSRIETKLDQLIGKVNTMSTAVADLQAAVANIQTTCGNAISLLNQLFALAQSGATLDPADAAAIEAQVALLNTR